MSFAESHSTTEPRTAEQESETSLRAVFEALEVKRNFLLEAGAGAGKTYSLIAALRRILEEPQKYLPRSDQQVACLTYTKVARDEIIRRTDASPRVFADTIHGFLWQMIAPYQRALARSVLASDAWTQILDGRTSLDELSIEYDLGIRGISDTAVRLHHDDVPSLAVELLKMPKFRSLIADRFPIIFIDEYQDTPQGLVEAFLSNNPAMATPLLGFFGDHWQQIYEKSSGSIVHPNVTAIPKNANFRSATSIVAFLNGLRPELRQAPAADAPPGSVKVYHANSWPGTRLTHSWKGDISHEAAREVLRVVAEDTQRNVWLEATDDTKTLMLTHTALANELGYGSLPGVFRHNDAFAKKEDEVIAYLLDVVEPASEAFKLKRYGTLFEILGRSKPLIRSHLDKVSWTQFFDDLEVQRANAVVGDVLDRLLKQNLFSVPSRISKRQRALDDATRLAESGDTTIPPRRTTEYRDLRDVRYKEITALSKYVDDKTIFSTKHNVKGAEFDNVIVVLGRGWTTYDFAKMLSNHSRRAGLGASELASYEKSRNLFYVAASRAKQNLALIFTQELDASALASLTEWAGADNVVEMGFTDANSPHVASATIDS
jgi:DNA helicase-2/ATP-dependent DNA helicase PcrA